MLRFCEICMHVLACCELWHFACGLAILLSTKKGCVTVLLLEKLYISNHILLKTCSPCLVSPYYGSDSSSFLKWSHKGKSVVLPMTLSRVSQQVWSLSLCMYKPQSLDRSWTETSAKSSAGSFLSPTNPFSCRCSHGVLPQRAGMQRDVVPSWPPL